MPFIEKPQEFSPLSDISLDKDFRVNPGAENKEFPGLANTFGSAFRQENLVVNGVRALMDDRVEAEPDPNYVAPFDDIVGTEFDGHLDRFVGSRSPAQTEQIKQDIKDELDDRKTLEDAGVTGFLAAMTAGIFDVTTLLPLGSVVKGLKGGQSVVRSGVAVGTASAIDASISEIGLQGLQETRTLEESLFNIGGSFVLGGTIGTVLPGVNRILTNRQIKQLSDGIEADLKVPENAINDPFGAGGIEAALRQNIPDELAGEARRILPDDVDVRIVDDIASEIEKATGAQLQLSINTNKEKAILSKIATVKPFNTTSKEFKAWAPKGAKILHTEILQARKHKFKEGEPVVLEVYHGTQKDIQAFDPDLAGTRHNANLGKGVYFSTSPEFASNFAVNRRLERIHLELGEDGSGAVPKDQLFHEGRVIPAFVKLKNPAIITPHEKFFTVAAANHDPAKFQQNLIDQGFDGIISGSEIVVFDPRQIKSKFNRGTFDPNDPNILKQVGDEGIQGAALPEEKLILIARDAVNPKGTLRHESLEMLNSLGFFKEGEWKTLNEAAEQNGWIAKHNIEQRYQGEFKGQPEDIQANMRREAIAEEFSQWRSGVSKVEGTIKRLFEKIKKALDAVSRVVQGKNSDSFEDIFRRIDEGEIRDRGNFQGRLAASIDAGGVGADIANVKNNRLKSALGAENVFSFQDPVLRSVTSEFSSVRDAMTRLTEQSMEFTQNSDFVPTGPLGGSVEGRIKTQGTARLYRFITDLDAAYSKYYFGQANKKGAAIKGELNRRVSGDKRLTWSEFKEQVVVASRNGDVHEIPEVQEAAKSWRKELADPVKDAAIEVKLLPEDVGPETSPSYLTRVYNREKIKAKRPEFREMLIDYLDGGREQLKAQREGLQKELGEAQQTQARNPIDDFEEGLPPEARQLADDFNPDRAIRDTVRSEVDARIADIESRISDVDIKIQKSAKGIDELADMSRSEIRVIADEVIDNILGVPGGRILYRMEGTKAGPLHERTLKIPDNFIAKSGLRFTEFLENDIELIARYYTRSMVPDIEITRQFGDVDLNSAIAKIKDERDALIDRAATDQQVKAIGDRAQAHIKDLLGTADRMRGRYGVPEDTTAFTPRAVRTVKQLNLLRLLGGMTISAIPDVFRLTMTQGLTRHMDSAFKMIKNAKAVKLAKDEVKLAGTALDMSLDTRVQAMADIGEEFARTSKFERGVDALSSQFGVLSLMAPWNAFMKQWAGFVVQTRVLKNSVDLKSGKSIDPKEVRTMAQAGLDETMSIRIADQFEKHGSIEDGVYIANTLAWDDALARDAYRAVIVRDVDRIIVTPGQDRPLFASTQLGSMMFQFKSFAISSVQRTLLSGLQQRDLAVLMGVMGSIGAGMMSEYLKALVNDKPLPKTNAQWLVAGFDRSGLLAYLFDVNHFLERTTRGNIGIGQFTGRRVSRFASRNWIDSILGPTAGFAKDVVAAGGAAIDGEFSESDFRALRRSIPLQNLFYYSWLLKRYEKDIQGSLGLAPGKGFGD